jgi:hypothetical protein
LFRIGVITRVLQDEPLLGDTSCGDRSASLERFFGGWSERALAQSEIFDVGTIAILLKTNTLLTFAGELSYLK